MWVDEGRCSHMKFCLEFLIWKYSHIGVYYIFHIFIIFDMRSSSFFKGFRSRFYVEGLSSTERCFKNVLEFFSILFPIDGTFSESVSIKFLYKFFIIVFKIQWFFRLFSIKFFFNEIIEWFAISVASAIVAFSNLTEEFINSHSITMIWH